MSKIVLFGTGRGADVAYRMLKGDTAHEIVGFTVDGAHQKVKTMRGLPVVAFEEVDKHFPPGDYRMLILLGYQGMNGLRKLKFKEAKRKGYTLESYVASNIFRVEPISVGENCFIFDNQSISLDVKIGNNIVMWSSNHIGDLSTIEDHAWVSSHVTVAAGVTIKERAFLGIGSTVTNGVTIGEGSLIGAHVFVAADTEANSVYVHGQGKLDFDAGTFMRMMIGRKKL